MATFVLRVWVPDRPGALGAVASRIGAVRGDLVGIDILERDGGLAIDELVVEVPDASLVDLLVREVRQVDGVTVEDVRPSGPARDARLDALHAAAALVEQTTADGVRRLLVEHAQFDFAADWAAVVDGGTEEPLAATGPVPNPAWLAAFVAGRRLADGSPTVDGPDTGPEDVAWAALGDCGAALVLGRSGRPLRGRERRQLAALARIAAVRVSEVSASRAV